MKTLKTRASMIERKWSFIIWMTLINWIMKIGLSKARPSGRGKISAGINGFSTIKIKSPFGLINPSPNLTRKITLSKINQNNHKPKTTIFTSPIK